MVKELNVKEEKIDVKEQFEKGWLDVVAIIEIAGKPAEHVKQVLEKLLEGLGKEKDVKLIYKKINEPKEGEKTPGLFSAFAEIEFMAKSFGRVMEFVIDYMPSSVEIVAPTDLNIKLAEANGVLNDLVGKIFKYETFMKALAVQNMNLRQELEKHMRLAQLPTAKELQNSDEHERECNCDECSCDECNEGKECSEEEKKEEKKDKPKKEKKKKE
jgi:hypothetical protein